MSATDCNHIARVSLRVSLGDEVISVGDSSTSGWDKPEPTIPCVLCEIQRLEVELAAERAHRRLLEAALRWYADEAHYFESGDRDAPGELLSAGTVEEAFLGDRGERARAALARAAVNPREP
jgi:hypothetical protein